MANERERRGYLYLIPAVCTAAALSLDMGQPVYRGYPEAAWNTLFSLDQKSFLPLCLAVWLFYRRTFRQAGKGALWPLLLLWNAFAALVWLMAEGFRIDGTVTVLFSTAGQQVKSVLYFLGVTFGLHALSLCLYAILRRPAAADRPAEGAADAIAEENTGETAAVAGGAEAAAAAGGAEAAAAAGGAEAAAVTGGAETAAVTGGAEAMAVAGGAKTAAVTGDAETADIPGEMEEEAEEPVESGLESGNTSIPPEPGTPIFTIAQWVRPKRFQKIMQAVRQGRDGIVRVVQGARDEARRLGYEIRWTWHRIRKLAKRARQVVRKAGQGAASVLEAARRCAASAAKKAARTARRALDWFRRPVQWCAQGARWIGNRFPFLLHFLALLLLWSPHLLINYPAIMTPSAWNQLSQYFGLTPWANFHPPASTLLLGNIVERGIALGKRYGLTAPGNLGLFLYAVFQTAVLAAALAYVFRVMVKLHTPRWLRRTAFLCCLLAPFYTAYLATILKDSLYASCFLIMAAELSCAALRGRSALTDWRHVPLWCISVLGVMLLRHNGKYIVWPLALVLVLACLRPMFRGARKEGLLSAAAIVCVLFPVIAAGQIASTLGEAYEIEPGSVREAFSLPFQQTARYVKYYGGEVTEEEREIIDTVLDYDNLAKGYDPRLADPVKDSYREEADGEDLAAYFQVWFRQFLRHPGVYCAATAHQNYYLLYPFVPNESVFTGLDEAGRDSITKPLAIQPVPELKKAQFDLNHWYRVSFHLPVVGLMTHLAAYTLLFVWLALFALRRRLYRWLLPAFPVFLSLGVTVAAPVIQGHPRYAFPVVYAVPLLAALWIAMDRRRKEK